MLLGIADQGGNIMVGREKSIGEDFGAGKGEVGDGLGAEGDLVEVGGEDGGHNYLDRSN